MEQHITEIGTVDTQTLSQENTENTSNTKTQTWGIKKEVRMPHKAGLPLGCGGCGDAATW